MKFFTQIFFVLLFASGCSNFKKSQDEAVARVGNSYLYRSDLNEKFGEAIGIEDSLVKVQSYIEDWAKNTILYEQALVNLSEDRIKSLGALVEEYKFDLFSTSYKEQIVKSSIDTLVQLDELKSFYEENKEIFKLRQPLYRIRALQFPSDNVERREITKRFRRFDNEDRFFLDSLSFHFVKAFLNDTLWITKSTFFKQVSFLTKENVNAYLRKRRFFEVETNGEVSLLFVNDYMERDEIAPLEYIAPRIQKIILNKRKLEFIKQFDREILQDAIQSKKFETY